MGLNSYKGEEVCEKLPQSGLNQVYCWILLKIRPGVAGRCSYVTGRISWISSFSLMAVSSWKAQEKISKKMEYEKAQAEYVQFAEQQRRLKEADGEKDFAGLLQWRTDTCK
ncbi:Uncharacterised protein [Serratia fonticola]|nr:Uncharacterised protein [Serratia fonticola]